MEKAKRFVSVKGLKQIGEGGFGVVYQLTEDSIVKVFREGADEIAIRKDMAHSRKAFIMGIPTAITFDLVDTEEGIGAVYEFFNAVTLADKIESMPEKLPELVEKFAQFLKYMETVTFGEGEMEYANACFEKVLDEIAGELPKEEVKSYKEIIAAVPKRLNAVHGDYHAKNIMVTNDLEFYLIDMDDFGCGHPIWDLGAAAQAYFFLPRRVDAERMKLFSGMTKEHAANLWDLFLNAYFEGTPKEEREWKSELIVDFGLIRELRIAAILLKVSDAEINCDFSIDFIKEKLHYLHENKARILRSLAAWK